MADKAQLQRMDVAFTGFDISPCLDSIAREWVKQFVPSANLPAGDVMSPDLQTLPLNLLRSTVKAVWAAGVATLPTETSDGSYGVSGEVYTSVSGLAMSAYPWTS